MRETVASLPDYEQPTFSSPATPQQVAHLEAAIGGPIPPDIRDFFAVHDEVTAMDIHNGYSIGGSTGLARSVARGDFPLSVDSVDVFPIGSDGGGNAFLMPRAGGGPVWKWRHDIGDFVAVADSFAQFLDRLADDFHAYADGRTDWDFMAG
ncbi:SMI1 / KNR4 family protein [Rubripirellula amarantea]|uniref:SMI1 / KNR4 family protein n=1 Tax=Rubripirellula amarantea TaxID=2527999 RepID=A0A5C5WHS3_9BACT|nr:SMI1/KNR4 family protein [Rubripirellula amarantea]TWT49553.1 SMI1 / KNR4 family protein [Rubripirellula amarantea]